MALSSSVSRLGDQVSQISDRLSAETPHHQSEVPSTSLAPPAVPYREPHIPSPERYSGDLGACGRFLLQCSLVFDQQPLTYATDKSRIAFVISLLTGKASQWATAAWESNALFFDSYATFTNEMKKIFDHPLRGKEAAKRLLTLHQGARPVAEYAIDFRILATESGWDDTALQDVFIRGLSDNVKDELAARDETRCLDELISLATRLDNRLRERRREKASRQSSHVSNVSSPVPVQTGVPPMLSSQPNPPDVEEPMQLGRAQLTPAERQHRQKFGLCLYCGQKGHFVSACRLRPKE